MSSNIQVRRICQHCEKEFIARTTVTKFCSHKCSRSAYKVRKRAEKIKQSESQTLKAKQKSIEQLQVKDFLTVSEVSKLLNCSSKSVYRYIKSGTISAVNLGQRLTRIKRSELDKLFQTNIQTSIKESETLEPVKYEIEDCFTIKEVKEKYGVSEAALNQMIKRNSIPKIKKGRYAYVPKKLIRNLLT